MKHLIEAAGLSDHISVDSAGTSAYHIGEPADVRSSEYAAQRGITLDCRARQFELSDFDQFDYVIAMDRSNFRNLHKLTDRDEHHQKLHLLRSFDKEATQPADVPDPYYGGDDGFSNVFEICESACKGLLDHLRTKHQL